MTASLRLTLTGALASAAAAASLGGLFDDGSPWWRWSLTGLLGVLAGLLGARALRLPEPLVLLSGAGALTLVLTALGAGDRAVLGVLPTPDALASLRAAFAAGRQDVVQLTVPVPPTAGLLLLTATGVGAVALAVDALATGARRPALAGVPLLALVVVPSGLVPGGVGWLPFALAASGWLALLLADGQARAAQWGRLVTGPGPAVAGALGDRPDAAPRRPGIDARAHAGRRIGAAAVGVSIVAPLLVPAGLQGRFDGGTGWGGLGGVGSASVDTYNPIVRLKGELTRPEPRRVLRVLTTDPDYVRLTALDLYDGSTWSQSPLTAPRSQRVSEGVPLPAGLPASATRAATATIEVTELSTRWLPVHYPPREVDVRGDWRYDVPSRTVFSSRDETRDLPPYTVASARVDVTAESLDGRRRTEVDESLQPFLTLPPLPDEVVATASQVTAEAENDYERAVALQEFFRSTDFVYDERVPEGNSGDDLLDFLRSRRGYCEQFAAAMAVMARAVGLPARVAIGYTAGREVEPGVWVISSHDAHAWPEVNLPGAGWIRFEPTPRDDRASPAPPYSIPPEPVEAAPLPELPAPPPDAGRAVAPRLPEGAFPGRTASTAAAEDGRAGVVALAVIAVLLLALTPAAVHAARLRRAWDGPRTPRRARRGAAAGDSPGTGTPAGAATAVDVDGKELARRRAEAAWQQVRETALDLGLPWRDSDAPRAAAARLVGEVGLAGEPGRAVQRLATALEVARYSPRAPRSEGLRADAREVRAGLRAGVPPAVRWRATLLPRSTLLAAARAVGSAVADLLDVLDGVGARVRRTVARRAGRLTDG